MMRMRSSVDSFRLQLLNKWWAHMTARDSLPNTDKEIAKILIIKMIREILLIIILQYLKVDLTLRASRIQRERVLKIYHMRWCSIETRLINRVTFIRDSICHFCLKGLKLEIGQIGSILTMLTETTGIKIGSLLKVKKLIIRHSKVERVVNSILEHIMLEWKLNYHLNNSLRTTIQISTNEISI